jgi:prepilin-type processing-associated H-X9-DG protein
MAGKRSNRNGQALAMGILRIFLPIALIFLAFDVFIDYSGQGHADMSLVCASNLKAMGLGFQQYAQDYDMKLPAGIRRSAAKNAALSMGLGWSDQTYPYVKREYVYKCPDDMSKCISRDPIISYAYNINAAKNDRLSKWTRPSATVLLFEVSTANAPVAFWPDRQQIASGELSPVGDGTTANLIDGQKAPSVRLATGDIGRRPTQYPVVPRHSDSKGNRHRGAIYLLADGHVAWILPENVSSGINGVTSTGSQDGGSIGHARGAGLPGVTFSTQ